MQSISKSPGMIDSMQATLLTTVSEREAPSWAYSEKGHSNSTADTGQMS